VGYDLRLLRKVWIRTVPPGTPPVAAAMQKIGRVGRLRWLAGRRSETENWDAFEGVGGQSLLQLAENRQNWSQVRFWLYDLGRELCAAEKDHTLPETLAPDRVWITADGRAKLLDFAAPGLAGGPAPGPTEAAATPLAAVERAKQFLSEVAVTALKGECRLSLRESSAAFAERKATRAAPAVPLPLHARDFLNSLLQPASRPCRHGAGPDTLEQIVAALEPLLRRVTSVSRLRRAAVVAGCLALPLLGSFAMVVGTNMIRQRYPGMMELGNLLHARPAVQKSQTLQAPRTNPSPPEKNAAKSSPAHNPRAPTDRELAIYIASHYRATITNDEVWNSPMALSLIQGKDRRFAEQSIAENLAPTAKEMADAEEAVKPFTALFQGSSSSQGMAAALGLLAIYVCLPALIAAMLFRGGLALRAAGIALVRRDGRPASRLRVFWRALVAWVPFWTALLLLLVVIGHQQAADNLSLWMCCGSCCAFIALSLAMPRRGLPDRLAGIWPVPR